MKISPLILLFTVLAYIAGAQARFEAKKGGHCYTLDIPNYMTKTFELNDAASLQYQNTAKEAYIIAIEDSKEELESLGLKFVSAKDFLESFVEEYQADASERTLSPIKESASLGNTIAQTELTWENDGSSFFMLVTAVESKSHFYKILTWTIGANKDLLLKDFIAVSKSLKD